MEDLLFTRPFKGKVCYHKRRHDVEELGSGPPVCIEDSCIQSTGERSLTIRGERICCDAFLRLRACATDS